MISIETVSVFVPASLALILAPGPDTDTVSIEIIGRHPHRDGWL